jgi:hypothetical protein
MSSKNMFVRARVPVPVSSVHACVHQLQAYPMGVQIEIGPGETSGQVEPKPAEGAKILDTYDLDVITVHFGFIDASDKELAKDFKLRAEIENPQQDQWIRET